jgi:hypothetical protein
MTPAEIAVLRSEKITVLEARLLELDRTMEKMPEIVRVGLRMVYDEVKDRLSYLKAGQPDPYDPDGPLG